MRIKYHYCMKNKMGLLNFLEKHEVPYEIVEMPEIKYSVYVFDLYEGQEAYLKFKIQFPYVSRFDVSKTIEYSKEDIEKAEWLLVRNKSIKVQWEYEPNAFIESCGYKKIFIKGVYYRHIEQNDILSVTRPVKWGTRQFFSGPNAADDIIFCSEKAKNILENKWRGLEFWPVKKYNTSKYIKDLYQLFFAECLPIESLSGVQSVICKGCGRKIISIPQGLHQLKIDRNYLQDQMTVYRTGDVLTQQLMRYETFSVNIVSQDFYQFCEKHQMNRGMIYEPVTLV